MHSLIERRKHHGADLIRILILSWLTAAVTMYLTLPKMYRSLDNTTGIENISHPGMILVFICSFVLWTILPKNGITVRIQKLCILILFGVYASAALFISFSWIFLFFCVLISIVLLIYMNSGWDRNQDIDGECVSVSKVWMYTTAFSGLFLFILLSAWTVGRVRSFTSPTYDFGIFSQMFYYMKETGHPFTTVERDGLLSHFHVHVSPIYYLLLPFYCLAPVPETLQILQAAVVASAVIPLWKICGLHGFTGAQRMLCCLLLMLFPAFAGGVGYDIHENCFLTPLILWMFYGIDRKCSWLTFGSLFLILAVKEDAAVYTAVIGLWMLMDTCLHFDKKTGRNISNAVLIFLISVFWFLLVTSFLAQKGDGVMTNRYQNLMSNGSESLVSVILSVFLLPMKCIYECADPEKISYFVATMLPLLGIPLLTRKYERYILLIPYILINLMPDYRYQHDLFFQYNFGSTAFLIYLTLVNLKDLRKASIRTGILFLSVAVSACFFGAVIVPKAVSYPVSSIRNHEQNAQLREALEIIPESASVTASTGLTTPLSQRRILYDVRYASLKHLLETEYIVLNPKSTSDYKKYASEGKTDGYKDFVGLLERNGYVLYAQVEGSLEIYRRE